MTLSLFASCLPGLEPVLLDELVEKQIGTAHKREPGGVAFSGDKRALIRANLMLGTAQRVLMRFPSFHASKFAELVRKAEGVPFEAWVTPDLPLTIRAKSQKSKLYHSGAIVERVTRAVETRLGQRVQIQTSGERTNDTQELLVRITHNKVRLSVETSGEPLFRRGYRRQTAKAPLRPDLACALIRVSGWNRRDALLDPMMGSGTIPIEAALLSQKRPPGGAREFLLSALPLVEKAAIDSLKTELDSAAEDGALIFGSDRDGGALEAATANAERADVSLELSQAAISDAKGWGEAGFLVTNPPYGKRVRGDRRKRGGGKNRDGGPRDLRPLFSKLGALITKHTSGAAFVFPDKNLGQHLGISSLESALMTEHGGIKVRFLRTNIEAEHAESAEADNTPDSQDELK